MNPISSDASVDIQAIRARQSVQCTVYVRVIYSGQVASGTPAKASRRELPQLPFVSLREGVVGDGKAFFRDSVARAFEGVGAKGLSNSYHAQQTGQGLAFLRHRFDQLFARHRFASFA